MTFGIAYILTSINNTFVFERDANLFIGSLSLSFEFVVAMIDRALIGDERLCLVQSLYHLSIFSDDLVALAETQFVVLKFTGSDNVGDVPRTEKRTIFIS